MRDSGRGPGPTHLPTSAALGTIDACCPPFRCRHIPRHVRGLGLLAAVLDDAGWHYSYRAAATDGLDDASIAQADLLIVLGGPMGVYEADKYPFLAKELGVLERRLGKGLPTLGIRLGSQLMASALGSRVFAGPVKEIGWEAIALTADGRASCLQPLAEEGAMVLHWHGDTFDLPAGGNPARLQCEL